VPWHALQRRMNAQPDVVSTSRPLGCRTARRFLVNAPDQQPERTDVTSIALLSGALAGGSNRTGRAAPIACWLARSGPGMASSRRAPARRHRQTSSPVSSRTHRAHPGRSRGHSAWIITESGALRSPRPQALVAEPPRPAAPRSPTARYTSSSAPARCRPARMPSWLTRLTAVFLASPNRQAAFLGE
jgi:hypothetical protein